MTHLGDTPPDDGQLTAYLDGQLPADQWRRVGAWIEKDAATRGRLEALREGGRPFKSAFELVLHEAPSTQLRAALEAAAIRRRAPRGWMMAAAAIALLLGGALLGQAAAPHFNLLARRRPAAYETVNWREAVATYFKLQTPETLADIPDDAQARASEIALASSRLNVGISPETVNIPGLQVKRANLYWFQGMPLVELLYSGSPSGPIAFCIIANGKPDAPMARERIRGFNIIFWQSKGHGFLLIGRASADDLGDRASLLRARFSS